VTGYLICILDTSVVPPVVQSVGVYGESAQTLTMLGKEFALDIVSWEGVDYAEAKLHLLHLVRTQGWYAWCRPFLEKDDDVTP